MTLVKNSEGSGGEAPVYAGVLNNSFENDLASWTTTASAEGAIDIRNGWSPENGGSKRLNYWSASAFTADTQQTIDRSKYPV